MKLRLLSALLTCALVLSVQLTMAAPVRYEVSADGKTQAAAENACRLKALRQCMNAMSSPDLLKKNALVVRERVLKNMQTLTQVQVLETTSRGSRTHLKAQVTVDADALHAALKTIPQLAASLKEPASAAPAPAEPAETPEQAGSAVAQTPEAQDSPDRLLAAQLLQKDTPADAQVIRDTLGKGADPNLVPDPAANDWPALFLYLRSTAPDAAVVQLFLDRKADAAWVSSRTDDSVLRQAVLTQNEEILRMILKAGVRMDQVDSAGQTILHTWLEQGKRSPELLKAFLDAGFDPNMKRKDEQYGTPALFECIKGVSDAVPLDPVYLRTMLSGGADPDITDAKGASALYYAVELNAREHVLVLLENGADPAKATARGETPLLAACETPGTDPGIVSALVAKNARPDTAAEKRGGLTPLIAAVRAGREDLVRILLDAGAAVDATTSDGRTALIFATDGNRPGIARLLLEKGADPKHTDASGNPPLAFAVRGGQVDLVRLLCENGADLNATVPYRKETRSLRDIAAAYGSDAMKECVQAIR